MRKLSILILLVGLTALAGDTVGPKARDVGRFRLLRAPVTYATDRTKVEVNTILKIDSLSGDTWLLKAAIKSGEVFEYWSPLENNQARQKTAGPALDSQTNR